MKRLICLPLILLIVSCTSIPTPESARERYLAAEAAYSITIDSVEALITGGVLKPGTSTSGRVATAVLSTREGLNAWRANVDASNLEIAAMGALSSLQALVRELQ